MPMHSPKLCAANDGTSPEAQEKQTDKNMVHSIYEPETNSLLSLHYNVAFMLV